MLLSPGGLTYKSYFTTPTLFSSFAPFDTRQINCKKGAKLTVTWKTGCSPAKSQDRTTWFVPYLQLGDGQVDGHKNGCEGGVAALHDADDVKEDHVTWNDEEEQHLG